VNRGRRSAPPEPPKSNPPLRRAPLSPATLPPPAAKNQPALRGDTGSTSASSNAAAAANKTAGGGSAQSAGPAAGAGGTGVSPLIEWAGGITRQRIAGSMPGFPDGVNREAQIVARFVVEPDGEIRDIVFLRKGEPRFEERVLAAMRGWRFNRLPAAVGQADQTGKATFYFKLK
jgi:TonB family protein